MAELTPSERLQPCLLDRLTDDDPSNEREARDERVINMRRYRQAVFRDLSWLLNTSAHVAADGLEDFEEVPSSVLNFGVRDITGMTTSGFEADELQSQILDAIRRFEPRIQAGSFSVKVRADPSAMHQRAVSFEIKGDLWAQPTPESLYIRTEIDLETGNYQLKQGS